MSEYKYALQKLSPKVFADLVLSLYADGDVVMRADIIATVSSYHQSNGGAESTASITSTAKKALQNLSASGNAEKLESYGFWRILQSAAPQEKSCEYLYVYFYPAYRDLASMLGNSCWPHKIGMTRMKIEERIASQVGTAMPEKPEVVFEIPCDDAQSLEKAIHSLLTIKGKRISGIPGCEWYNTNSEELSQIISFCGHSIR